MRSSQDTFIGIVLGSTKQKMGAQRGKALRRGDVRDVPDTAGDRTKRPCQRFCRLL